MQKQSVVMRRKSSLSWSQENVRFILLLTYQTISQNRRVEGSFVFSVLTLFLQRSMKRLTDTTRMIAYWGVCEAAILCKVSKFVYTLMICLLERNLWGQARCAHVYLNLQFALPVFISVLLALMRFSESEIKHSLVLSLPCILPQDKLAIYTACYRFLTATTANGSKNVMRVFFLLCLLGIKLIQKVWAVSQESR